MATADQIVETAREQYAETGTLDTTIFMALTSAGIDGNILMAQFEAEKNG